MKPGRRPPHIAGRRVSTVYQGRVGAPKELATFRVTTLSLISSNEACGAHEITPRLFQNLLDSNLSFKADVGRDRREKSIYSGKLEN